MKQQTYFIGAGIVVIIGVLVWTMKRPEPVTQNTNTARVSTSLTTMTSPDFVHDGQIPKAFTCNGESRRPQLDLASLPPGARYLSLLVQDLDASQGIFDHWVVWDIPVTNSIGPDFSGGITGKNSTGKTEYAAPCPPSGEHRYRFRVYGYNQPVALKGGSTSQTLQPVMDSRALIRAEMIGRYSK